MPKLVVNESAPWPLTVRKSTPVMPAPLPLNVPEIFTPLAPLVTTVAGSCPSGIVPVSCATGTLPESAAAVMAYGVGVTGWRGVSTPNAPPPLVPTPSSSQRAAPGN